MRYLRNTGLALDRLLNAAILRGEPHETVSEHAAKEALQGKRWACRLCKWLHYTVEAKHCEKTLDPNTPTKTAACIKALAQMVVVVLCAIHLYGWWVWG